MFQREDPAFTRSPVEVRYPFLDLRIINYLLAIPTMPWFFRKHLLREAMRGRLPEGTRKRPKRSEADDLVEAIRRDSSTLKGEFLVGASERFFNISKLVEPTQNSDGESVSARVRAWCLSFWIKESSDVGEEVVKAACA